MITRWDVDYEATCMFVCSDGDYVLFEDYEQLQQLYNELTEKYNNLAQEYVNFIAGA